MSVASRKDSTGMRPIGETTRFENFVPSAFDDVFYCIILIKHVIKASAVFYSGLGYCTERRTQEHGWRTAHTHANLQFYEQITSARTFAVMSCKWLTQCVRVWLAAPDVTAVYSPSAFVVRQLYHTEVETELHGKNAPQRNDLQI